VIKPMFATLGVALILLFGPGAVHAQRSNNERGGNYRSDAQQLGYEHGYRDGADRGRQDRDSGRGRSLRDTDYDQGRHSYGRSFGDRREYMSAYRDGYQAGYDDGFRYYEQSGRYGQIYQGRSVGTPFDHGYREGIAAGQDDVTQNTRSDYRRADSYRNGDQTFRDGVDRGYQDGYGRSRYQTDGGGYFPNQGTTGPADTRDGAGAQSRTISVPSTRQWTPTSIRVNQGDRIEIQASGEIQLSQANTGDRARVAGSLAHRYAAGAPLPKAFAGALIGRIDNGRPFGIGNQTSIVAPAGGLLYLGINDDALAGNSGQFQVVVAW